MEQGFSPIDTLERTLKNWWIVVLMMLLGAGAGWGVHRIRPAQYEARAAISVAIDFIRTGALTDVEEDYAIGVVGDVIGSAEVMDAVFADARQKGYAESVAGLKQAVYPERHNHTWVLRVRHPDPQAAAWLANRWGEAASVTLDEALGHALAADSLVRRLDALESCLARSVTAGPVQAVCNPDGLAQTQAEMARLNAALKEEQLGSQGMLAYSTFTLTETAQPPARPVLYRTGQMMLSGALIGLLISIWLAYLRLPERLTERRRFA